MIELWDNRRVHRLVRTLETKVEAETMIADQKVNLKRYDKISAVLQDAGQIENEEGKVDKNEHATVNAVSYQKRNQTLRSARSDGCSTHSESRTSIRLWRRM